MTTDWKKRHGELSPSQITAIESLVAKGHKVRNTRLDGRAARVSTEVAGLRLVFRISRNGGVSGPELTNWTEALIGSEVGLKLVRHALQEQVS